MATAWEQKRQMIDDYINKLDDVIKNNDVKEAEILQDEIIGVYECEIENIKSGLSVYTNVYLNGPAGNYIADARLLKAKLSNYKLNLASGFFKYLSKNNNGVNLTQNVNQDVNTSVEISLNNTVSSISNLPDSVLSDEEKELLNGKLVGISAEKDKSKCWEKIKKLLVWIADKGIEVAIAVLPYLAKTLEGK